MNERVLELLATLAEERLHDLRARAAKASDTTALERNLEECQGALASSQQMEEFLRRDLGHARGENAQLMNTNSQCGLHIETLQRECTRLRKDCDEASAKLRKAKRRR